MRKSSSSDGGGKRGCGCSGLDFFVLFVVLALVAWFGPWRQTLRKKGAPYLGKVPVIGRIFPSPSPSPSAPGPAASPSPSPTPPVVPSPSPTTAATPTPGPSPSPIPGPEPTPADAPRPEAPYGSLSRGQNDRVRDIIEKLDGADEGEAKRWQDNLAYDANPEREIRVWERIARAYEGYVAKYPALQDDARREVFQAALMGTLLPEREAVPFLKLKTLSPEQAREVMKAAADAAPGDSEPLPDPAPTAN